MSREVLHNLVNVVDEREIETVYKILLRFIEEDKALPDEAAAIRQARKDIANGELYSHNEVRH